MGGKRRIDPVLKAKMEEEKRISDAKKAKESLVIRACIAVVVVVAAVIICVLTLTHDFNAERHSLHGTYIAERSYIVTTASGTELVPESTFPVVFCEDGRLLYRYDSGTSVNYYEYKDGSKSFDGRLLQYTNGRLSQRFDVMRGENGDITLYCTVESVGFSVGELIEYFGEESTRDMLRAICGDEMCDLLIAGDYESITDEQLQTIGVSRQNLGNLTFSMENMQMIYELHKVSDEELSKSAAIQIREDMTRTVSNTDTVSDSEL